MTKLLLIALGGAIGSVLRHVLTNAGNAVNQRIAPESVFTVGTLCVNVLGCLLIGMLGARFAGAHADHPQWRAFLIVGILGGFTTFSAFAFESFKLANEGSLGGALANILLTNMLCLAAAFIGYRVNESLVT